MEELIKILSEACGYSYDQIIGLSRTTDLSTARQVIWKVLKDRNYSYPEIGKAFGRGHSSILHGVARINDLVSIGDKRVAKRLKDIGLCFPGPVQNFCPKCLKLMEEFLLTHTHVE